MPARGLFQDGISHSSQSFSNCLAEETAKNGGGQDHIVSRMASLCTLLPPLKAGRRLWGWEFAGSVCSSSNTSPSAFHYNLSHRLVDDRWSKLAPSGHRGQVSNPDNSSHLLFAAGEARMSGTCPLTCQSGHSGFRDRSLALPCLPTHTLHR